MGQYYKPINLTKKQWLYSHDYHNGLKLMEHSYLGNNFMKIVEKLLSPTGSWHKDRIVWAGDYADKEAGKKKEHQNLYHTVGKKKNNIKPEPEKKPTSYRYLINHTKKAFVDLRKIMADKDGLKIHPLSLFTAEGNGRGGGDFHGDDARIGAWARNSISVEDVKPAEYTEVCGQFVEK